MSQIIEELVVKITGDTADVESKIKRLGQVQRESAQQLAASQAQSAREGVFAVEAAGRAGAAQQRFAGREARRDVRAELAEIKDAISDAQQISAGFADKLFGIDADRQRATRLAGTIGDISAQLKNNNDLTDAQRESLKKYREAAAVELQEIKDRWTNLGGAIRGTAATAVRSLTSGLVIGATIGVVTAAFDFFGQTVIRAFDQAINPAKAAAESFDRLGNSIRGIGGAARFGGIAQLGPELQSIADASERIGNQKPAYDALIALFGAAGTSGATGLTPEEVALRNNAKNARDTFLESIGFGNALTSVFTGFSGALDSLSGQDRIRDAFKNLGPEAVALFDQALSESNGINKFADAAGKAAEEFFKIKAAAIEANAAFQKQEAVGQGLLSTLRSGGVLQQEQLDLLKSVTTEEERRLLLSYAQRDVVRQQAAAIEEVANIQEDIAILEGRRSGDANKDALADIDKARARLDNRERAIEERAFRQQRQQALANIEAALGRAGIRQAGQTSFDVYAAQREAEAQAARAQAGFRDEDERRAIAAARRELDEKERGIRRSIDLATLESRLLIAQDNKRFANLRVEIFNTSAEAAKALGLVYTVGLQAISGLAGAMIAAGSIVGGGGGGGRFGRPLQYAAGGRVPNTNPIIVGEYGPELFIPDSAGTVVPNNRLQRTGETTIIIQSTPVMLDGEVIGRTIERRVTARSNRRAALGIA